MLIITIQTIQKYSSSILHQNPTLITLKLAKIFQISHVNMFTWDLFNNTGSI